MSRRRLAALTLVATVLAASGCGGSAGSTKPLTRSELIARGDTICRRINARLAAIRIKSAKDYARLGAFEQAAVANMRELTPPASMSSGWGQVVSGAQTLADATAKIGTFPRVEAFGTTPAAHEAFAAAGAGTRQMVAAAQREGFKDCARTP
jgi:hypothetical protein